MGMEKFARFTAVALSAGALVAESPAQAQTAPDYEVAGLRAQYEQAVDRDVQSLRDSVRRYDDPSYYDQYLVANIARRTALIVPNCEYDPRQPHRVLPTGEQFLAGLSPRVFTLSSTRAGNEMLSQQYGEFERACANVYEDGQRFARELLALQAERERDAERDGN